MYSLVWSIDILFVIETLGALERFLYEMYPLVCGENVEAHFKKREV